LARKLSEVVVGDAELGNVPGVEDDAAVFCCGAFNQSASVLEIVDDAEGH